MGQVEYVMCQNVKVCRDVPTEDDRAGSKVAAESHDIADVDVANSYAQDSCLPGHGYPKETESSCGDGRDLGEARDAGNSSVV